MRKLKLRDISYHTEDQYGITDMYQLELRALQIHSRSSTFHCLRDGERGFSQFTGERDYSNVSAIAILGGEDM